MVRPQSARTYRPRFPTDLLSIALTFTYLFAVLGCQRTSLETVTVADQAKESDPEQGKPPVQAEVDDLPSQEHPAETSPHPGDLASPTDEQLARWNRTPFEEIELLECRTSKHTGYIEMLDCTPDGQSFVTAGKQLIRESIRPGEISQTLIDLRRSSEDVWLKCVSISNDGKFVASGDSEGWLRVWDLAEKKEVAAKQIYSNDVVQLAISPDSSKIATISFGDEISVWQFPSLREMKNFKVEDTSLAQILFVQPNVLAVAGQDMGLRDITTGNEVAPLSKGKYLRSMARSQNGARCAFLGDGGIVLWDTAQGRPQGELPGFFHSEELFEFSLDDKYLVTASGSAIRIWDLESRQTVQVLDTFGPAIIGLRWVPSANVLLVGSENGVIRIWGTAKAGARLSLKPLHAPIELANAEPKAPATPAQWMNIIDLRIFPRPPQSTSVLESEQQIQYVTPTDAGEVRQFYAYHLGKRGWQQLPVAETTPDYLEFTRSGFGLWGSIRTNEENKTEVNLVNMGNFGPLRVPRFDGGPIEVSYESASTVHYETSAELLEIETNLLRKLHDAGWTPYSRLHSSYNEEVDARNLEFLWNSTILNVSIRRFPATPDRYTVQYSNFFTTRSIPIPQDAGFVEFDGSSEPYLVAHTAMKLDETRAYYDQEMKLQGWLPYEKGRSLKEKYNWLPYFRGQRDVMIGISTMDNGRTLIRVGEDLDKASWQLAALNPPPESDAENAPSEPQAEKTGIQAADFPFLKSSKAAQYDRIGQVLEFEVEMTSIKDVIAEYDRTLGEVGWKLDPSGVRSDEYASLTFTKGDAEIAMRLRTSGEQINVNVQGEGLLWDKELPGGKKVVSFETWLRLKNVAASLNLLDEYQAEMKSLSESR